MNYADDIALTETSQTDMQQLIRKIEDIRKCANIWKSKSISLPVNIKVYESLVISSLMYGAELWPFPVIQKKTGSSSSQVPVKTVSNHVERHSEK